MARVDRRLAAILGGSVALHVAIAAYAWCADVEQPEPVAASAIPVEYQEIDIMIPDFTPPETVTATTPGAATPVAPNQTPNPIVRRPTVRPQITTGTKIDPGQLAGLFNNNNNDAASRRPTLDLAEQIRDVREGHLEIGKPSPDDDRPRIGTSSGVPGPTDPTPVARIDPRHDEPHGRIIPGTVKPETSTTLSAALVLQIIQNQYMRGLQRCYQRGFTTDGPSLSGKVALELTVGETGQVTEHSASGVSETVDTCIDKQMSTWRFPTPRDIKGNPTEAPFAVTLALQPS